MKRRSFILMSALGVTALVGSAAVIASCKTSDEVTPKNPVDEAFAKLTDKAKKMKEERRNHIENKIYPQYLSITAEIKSKESAVIDAYFDTMVAEFMSLRADFETITESTFQQKFTQIYNQQLAPGSLTNQANKAAPALSELQTATSSLDAVARSMLSGFNSELTDCLRKAISDDLLPALNELRQADNWQLTIPRN